MMKKCSDKEYFEVFRHISINHSRIEESGIERYLKLFISDQIMQKQSSLALRDIHWLQVHKLPKIK